MLAENVDEDDMPPRIDNPTKYTFFSPTESLSFPSEATPTNKSLNSPPISPMPVRHSRTHGKRRDPSYIPRPPNAFILFRCAFVKEQNIPGRVEGNHSRLSKIIGLCWKQLPPEEREKWEAKAVLAQAEHRALYPDWRFRPGANAMAKLKIKEEQEQQYGMNGNGLVSSSSSRRRSARGNTAKDPQLVNDDHQEDDGKVTTTTDLKGKGKAKAPSRMHSLEETRCAKIAGFVAEGIKGEELEVAVKEWEGDHRLPKIAGSSSSFSSARTSRTKGRSKATPSTASSSSHVRSRSDAIGMSTGALMYTISTQSPPEMSSVLPVLSNNTSSNPQRVNPTPTSIPNSPVLPDQNSPAVVNNDELKDPTGGILPAQETVPLTHMYKRSVSSPIVDNTPTPTAFLGSENRQRGQGLGEGSYNSPNPASTTHSPSEESQSQFEPFSSPISSRASANPSLANSVWGDDSYHSSPVLQDVRLSGVPARSRTTGSISRTTTRHDRTHSSSVPMPRLLPMSVSVPSPSSSPTTSSALGSAQQRQPRSGLHFDAPHSHSHQLTWQDAENQRRIEEIQNPELWWTSARSTPSLSPIAVTDGVHGGVGSGNAGTLGMGYDMRQSSGNDFDRGFADAYGTPTFEHPSQTQDGTRAPSSPWAHLSPISDQTHGFVTIVDDPYADHQRTQDKDATIVNTNSPSLASPPLNLITVPTLSLPPLSTSSGNYYQQQSQQHQPHSQFSSPTIPSSSFSTLTGWAGDLDKRLPLLGSHSHSINHSPSEMDMDNSWPPQHHPAHQSLQPQQSPVRDGMYYQHPPTHAHLGGHHHLGMGADDWERYEYRHVESPRQWMN